MHLGDAGRTHRHGIDGTEKSLQRCAEAGLDRHADLFEGDRRKAVLQAEQIMRRFLADDIGPRRQRLAQLDRGRTDGTERPGIVGSPRLARAEAGDAHQPADLRWRIRVGLDTAQGAVARQGAAPTQQAPDMGCGSCHLIQVFQPE